MHKTPLQSVREYCKWCGNDSAHEVLKCQNKDCQFYHLRFGYREEKISVLGAIRERCLDCMGGSPRRVKNCSSKDCHLYIYRLGHNPARRGIGHTKEFMQKVVVSARKKKVEVTYKLKGGDNDEI